jgi:hypothetical protein
MDKINDNGHRPGRRTPVQLKERGDQMRAWLASHGEELHTTKVGRLKFTEIRKIGAPSVFDKPKQRESILCPGVVPRDTHGTPAGQREAP